MMNCFFAKNHLFSYMDGTLAPFHIEELKAHLENCVSCKRVHEELLIVRLSFKGIPPVEITDRLRLQIRTSLHKQKNLSKWYAHSLFSPGVLAVLASFGLTGLILGLFAPRRLPMPTTRAHEESVIETAVAKSALSPATEEQASLTAEKSQNPSEEAKNAVLALPSPANDNAANRNKTPATALVETSPKMSLANAIKSPTVIAASPSPTNRFAGYDLRVSLQFETDFGEKGENGIRAECQKLQCRGMDGRSLKFSNDGGGSRNLAVQIPAKNYALLRSQVGKWGSFKDAVTVVPREEAAEMANREPPKATVEDLDVLGQTPVLLHISINQMASWPGQSDE